MQAFFIRHRTEIFFALLVLFYLVSGISYLRTQSVTADENSFYIYAKRWTKGNPERIDPATDDSKTPVVALNLLPRAVAQVFHPGLHRTDNGVTDIIHARYVTLFFSLLTLCLVFRWASGLFGDKAGLFAVLLMVLEPNFLASSGLVTTDSYSSFFLLAVMYSLWKLLRLRSWRCLVIFSVAVAGAQLVKQSLFHLYVLLPVVIIVSLSVAPRPGIFTLVKSLLLFVFIQWLLINLGYYFFGFDTRLGDYHFFSFFFQQLQQHLPSGLPVPFPRPFLQAFDMTKYYDEIGGGIAGKSGFGNVTLLGQSFRGHGVRYYYLVSLFFKTPVSFFILLGWALFLLMKGKFSDPTAVFCLLAPPGYFLVYFSFFYQVQIGVRHIVFLVPLMCVFLSGVLPVMARSGKRFILPGLSLYLFCSYCFYWQHQYSYTNEFIVDKTFAYRYVGSSNIDYGQGRYWGNRYLLSHPEVHWADSNARPGRYLVPVQEYMDIYNTHGPDWLNSHAPYGHVAFSNLLVEITEQALNGR